MIIFEKAYDEVLKTAQTIGIEQINFMKSVGRVLAEDIKSDINMPPFDKSAMDGYACRHADLANELEVVELIPAGSFPSKTIGKNQCAKIMTGAPVPQGADTVIMVEFTEKLPNGNIRFNKTTSSSNICKFAEDIRVGDIVLKKGTLIEAKHIPVLATVGAVDIQVFKKPVVAIIPTGDELVEPNIKPEKGQIRNSNAYQLMAAVADLGLDYNYYGIAEDTRESVENLIKKASAEADIIILSGAVSMGDFDFVPVVLKNIGIDIKFHGVAVKPGKKTIFGTSGKQWFFGAPGNPVSTYVQFEILIKPLIYKIMGCDCEPQNLKLKLAENISRKRAGRKSFEPVRILEDGRVKCLQYHGSAHINALTDADGLLIFEKGVTELNENALVDVRQI